MSAQRASVPFYAWLRDDIEEDLVGADWHQRAIHTLAESLRDLAVRRGWPWHVGDQLTLVARKPNGEVWRPSPDVMVHPLAGPTLRAEMSAAVEGLPALIVEVASATTWGYDVNVAEGKAAGYLALGIPEYLVFDPTGAYLGGPCRGWRNVEGEAVAWQPHADRGYVSQTLNIFLKPEGDLLRVYDPEGRAVLYGYEKAARIAALDRENTALAHELAALRAEVARLRGEDGTPTQ